MTAKWHICSQESDRVSEIAKVLDCHRAVAAALINRGFTKIDRARAFLSPSLSQIRSPFLMKDMEKAVTRIFQAIQQREKILVHGDYDVDGVTATALLLDFFGYLDTDISYHIPNRLTEGYGLSPEAVSKYAIARNTSLIITVDCGISSHDAVRVANRAGIDVIITDHHETPTVLPEALAIINPKQPDCPSRFTNLAGVGVAFCLVMALRKSLRDVGFWNGLAEPNLKSACDLVALGTVADMVPLLEENRLFVKTGLDVLSSSPRPGLKALLNVCGAVGRPLDTWDIAFKLAPRLNAAGRLGQGSTACELLTTTSYETATITSKSLDKKNNKRKDIEIQILADILHRLKSSPDLIQRTVVLESQAWHEGVIGIVASRLVKQYMRPVVLISLRDGMGKGSARSPKGCDLFHALEACSQYLEKFGGHEAAAGLSLKAENIPVFRDRFEEFVRNNTNEEDFVPTRRIDTLLAPHEISSRLLDDIERMAPFGSGNPEPLFMVSDLKVVSAYPIGGSHMKMRLRPANHGTSKPFDSILFDVKFDDGPPKRFRQIACNLRWNRWKNTKRLQLVIKDFVVA